MKNVVKLSLFILMLSSSHGIFGGQSLTGAKEKAIRSEMAKTDTSAARLQELLRETYQLKGRSVAQLAKDLKEFIELREMEERGTALLQSVEARKARRNELVTKQKEEKKSQGEPKSQPQGGLEGGKKATPSALPAGGLGDEPGQGSSAKQDELIKLQAKAQEVKREIDMLVQGIKLEENKVETTIDFAAKAALESNQLDRVRGTLDSTRKRMFTILRDVEDVYGKFMREVYNPIQEDEVKTVADKFSVLDNYLINFKDWSVEIGNAKKAVQKIYIDVRGQEGAVDQPAAPVVKPDAPQQPDEPKAKEDYRKELTAKAEEFGAWAQKSLKLKDDVRSLSGSLKGATQQFFEKNTAELLKPHTLSQGTVKTKFDAAYDLAQKALKKNELGKLPAAVAKMNDAIRELRESYDRAIDLYNQLLMKIKEQQK